MSDNFEHKAEVENPPDTLTLRKRLEDRLSAVLGSVLLLGMSLSWVASDRLRVEPRDFAAAERRAAYENLEARTAELREDVGTLRGENNRLQGILAERPEAVGSEPSPVAPTLEPPQAANVGVLFDLSHAQLSWPRPRGSTSVFSLVSDTARMRMLPSLERDIEVGAIEDPAALTAANLERWRGLILAMPNDLLLSPETRRAIVRWVEQGGRLVLLGFEQGDPHHGANLNTLAADFGLRFNADVAVPSDWNTSADPYGQRVRFTAADLPDHGLFQGVTSLVLQNTSTLMVEPGSEVVVALGDRLLSRLRGDVARYENRQSATGREVFEVLSAPWLSVIATTPEGFAGEGAVLAVGTWQIVRPDLEGEGNRRFLMNLVRWAAGRI